MSLNTGEIIQREVLFKLLDENASKKIIAAIAPAGYGKTTLIESYLKSRNIPNVWLNSTSGNNTLHSFTTQLIETFQTMIPEFGNRLSTTLLAAGKSNELTGNLSLITQDILNQFIEEFKRSVKDKFTVVIDDFHNLESDIETGITIFVENLIKADIKQLNFIITSRTEPSIGINYLKAKRKIFIITSKELSFTNQETIELAEKLYPHSTNSLILDKLESVLNGWITGIHLVLQSGNESKLNIECLTSVINESLYGFFIEEIWDKLEHNVKEFLLKTSYIESFTSKLCTDLYGFRDPEEIINYLLLRNIFIKKLSGSGNRELEHKYSYNDFFKQFLENQYSKSTKDEDRSSDLRSIAEYFRNNGDHENAIQYFLKAKCYTDALNIISKFYGSSYKIEVFKKAENWLAEIPEKLVLGFPEAVYLKAASMFHLNNDSAAALKLIIAVLSGLEDQKYRIKFTLLKAELMFTTGELEKICNELDSLDISGADTILKVHLKYILGKILYRSGTANYEKAKESLELALTILDESGEIAFRPEIFMLLGNLYQDLGEFEKSFFYRRKSIDLSENIYQKTQVYSNLVSLEIQTGKFEEAYETLGEMKTLYGKYPFRSIRRFFTKAEANFFYECGDHETCINKLEELIKIENSVNLTGFIWYNYLMEGLQLYYTDSQEYALQKFDIAESFIHKGDNYAKLLINQGRALCHLRKNSRSESALIEQYLTSIYVHYSLSGLKIFESQVSFYLASFYLRSAQFETTALYLKKALDPAHEKDLISFFERELPFHRDLFDFAVAEGINKPLVAYICGKFLGRSLFPWISKENKQRLKNETAKLNDIKLLPFGKTEIYLRGESIPEDKWIRKKSKILLAYLMCDPQKIHTKDKIIDMFFLFDDMPADKADMAYHSAIYNIRTALKIYDIKSDKPKRSKDKTYDYNPQYILYEDKSLRLNPDFFYTSDNVEFEKLYNKIKLPSLSIEEKITNSVKAIEMYKGDFLPGYYDSWCEELRVKYKNMFITLCEELIKLLENDARYEEVVKYSELLLNEDRLSDSTHISIINACVKLGNIKLAKSRFEIMLKIYDDELDEKPQPKTLEKITHILSEAAGPP